MNLIKCPLCEKENIHSNDICDYCGEELHESNDTLFTEAQYLFNTKVRTIHPMMGYSLLIAGALWGSSVAMKMPDTMGSLITPTLLSVVGAVLVSMHLPFDDK